MVTLGILPEWQDYMATVLRGHLLVEAELRHLITERCANPDVIDERHLSFSTLATVAEALVATKPEVRWVWVAVRQLNSVRNELAHALPRGEADHPKALALLRRLHATVRPKVKFISHWDDKSPINNALAVIPPILAGLQALRVDAHNAA